MTIEKDIICHRWIIEYIKSDGICRIEVDFTNDLLKIICNIREERINDILK